MRKRYSRSYTVLSFLTMFSYREQPFGEFVYIFPLGRRSDAHIGPLGSREFSRVPIKNQCILRADRSIRPKMRGIFRTLP